jgi:hypothetical protein
VAGGVPGVSLKRIVSGHAWYKLTIAEASGRKRRGLAVVEARDVVHARQLGIDLGAKHHELRIERLEPSIKRPLKRVFSDCPHCIWLKENGL